MNARTRFLRACRRESRPGEAPPFWVMRQAGRYLPEYLALRKDHGFMESVHDPAIAAELTCQPIRRYDMDAAVIFSDILVPLEALGFDVSFPDGSAKAGGPVKKGPQVAPPLRTRADLARFQTEGAVDRMAFVGQAIERVRKEVGDGKAIVGFCGAPFTTASYLIEGASSRNFERFKAILHGDPDLFEQVLERLTDVLIPYLHMQVQAGADVLQIFDSWGGALDAETYRARILPALARLVAGARETGVPVILYVNGGGHLLETLVDAGPDVLGIDWRVEPADAIRRVGDRVALQGNLDPCVLFAGPEVTAAETARVLDAFGNQAGYIFNLGSGILPKAPVDSMAALAETIHARRMAEAAASSPPTSPAASAGTA